MVECGSDMLEVKESEVSVISPRYLSIYFQSVYRSAKYLVTVLFTERDK